jgi:hypothetical protein
MGTVTTSFIPGGGSGTAKRGGPGGRFLVERAVAE